MKRALLALILFLRPLVAADPPETIKIDAAAPAHPFPHFWEQTFGSGRAVLSLRDSYRTDLRSVHDITRFEYIRFHAILDDDIGLYDEDANGNPIYNFSYVDQIYDSLLESKVRPFVELSFMPRKLALNLTPACLLVQTTPLTAEGPRQMGLPSSKPSPNTSSIAMAATKSRNGTSKCGTNPTSTSGTAILNNPLILRSTTYTAKAIKSVDTKAPRRRSRHCTSRLGRRFHRPLHG